MKILFIIALVPLFVSGIYVDPKCTFGESYWCSSLINAKNCRAVNHCKTTIWKNQNLQSDNTEVCQFCKAIIVDVSNYLKQNQSEAFISSFLESACDIVPNVNMVKKCKELVEGYLPEILDIIGLDLDGQAVCSLLSLCNEGLSFEDKVVHSSLSLPTSRVDDDLCKECIQFNTNLKEFLFGTDTQKKLIEFLDAYVCIGPLKQDCVNFVEKELPKIIKMIADKYDPNICCRPFCSSNQSASSNQMANLFNVYQKLNIKANTDKCTACMLIFGELQNLDQNKQIQKIIGDNVKNYICVYFKNYTSECINMVDMYLPIVFQFLASEMDPSARCRNFGFCPSQDANRIPMLGLVPAASAPPARHHMKDDVAVRAKASPVCIMCEYVMSQLQKLIADNKTEANIIAALDKVCGVLPKTVREECVSFVELYGRAILNLLLQDLSAEEICMALGICAINNNKLLFKPQTKMEQCELCQITMQYMESLLDQQSSLDEIKNLLEKVCNFLPEATIQQCEQMINNYEALIIDYLINKFTPKEICQKIKSCDAAGMDVKEGSTMATHKKLYFKCTYGPSYWCASQQNAALCQAEEHCKKYVWEN